MATIGISEPDPEVRTILARAVSRLGHEPVDADPTLGPDAIDLVIAEPADDRARGTAMLLAHGPGRIPVVCVSIHPRALTRLSFEPVAYLVKPFALSELQRAVAEAVAPAAASKSAA
jgi:hypothetical protein